MCGLHRARFWSQQGYPNLVRARAALAEKVRLRKLEDWKQQELKRSPYALLDNPPAELARPATPWNNRMKERERLARLADPLAWVDGKRPRGF